ncbi:MAG: hypothetical protein RL076_2494 [Chloroflexota bacterium]
MSITYAHVGEWTNETFELFLEKSITWGENDLAAQFSQGYASVDDAVDALIRWNTSANGLTGFVTGLGGMATLPFTIPVSVASSLGIQLSMTAAIASLYGYKADDHRKKIAVYFAGVNSTLIDVCRGVGIELTKKLSLRMIEQIPGTLIKEINKQMGFRLLTKMGAKGIINLANVVPVIGGLIGGTIDATACYGVGKIAKNVFRPIMIETVY